MQTTVRTYESVSEFQMDAATMGNHGWEVSSQVTEDNRKGSWGWFAFWFIVGLFTLVGFIGCLFTFPRGKQLIHVTYKNGGTN